MTQEEKAKAYDGLIERLKDLKFAYRFSPLSDTIEDIFPELKESEDERIRKAISQCVEDMRGQFEKLYSVHHKDAIAWLEKQGEQKPADKVEPKFHEGDWINGYYTNYKVLSVNDKGYVVEDVNGNKINILFENEKFHHLWTIQDAKDGDVLADSNLPFIFKKIDSEMHSYAYCGISVNDDFKIESDGESGEWTWMTDIKPATKEQRDLLFQKMKESGYEWDVEKKELKKVEQKPQRIVSAEAKEAMYDKPKWNVSDFRTWQYIVSDVLTKKDGIGQYLDSGECKKIAKYMQEEWSKKLNKQKHAELLKGEGYGIDGLYHAINILERTLGKVNGYQSDDGILEHKCALNAVKELYEQKPAWSEEDESIMNAIYKFLDGSDALSVDQQQAKYWLKSIKDRVLQQPKQEWKQENTHDLTDFENMMMHIGDSFFGSHAGLNPNDTNAIREQANFLLGLVQNQEWSEEEENTRKKIIIFLKEQNYFDGKANEFKEPYKKEYEWLKSLRPQKHWKPSAFHLECISDAIAIYEKRGINAIGLKEILEELKKLKG